MSVRREGSRRVLAVMRRRIWENPQILELILPYCREVIRRRAHPYYTYEPDSHPKRNQRSFLESRSMIRLLYGGNQSGKSRTLAQEIAWWLAEEHPYQDTPKAPRIYVISASYRTIQEGVLRHLKTCLPEWEIKRYGEEVPGWHIPSYIETKKGGRIDFISGEGREDARRKVASTEIDLGVVDEEIDGVIFEELMTRLLARGGRIVVGATLVRSEPWCMLLEDRAMSGDPDVTLYRLSTYVAAERGHVQSKIVKALETTLSASEVEVRLHGKSRRSEGLVYPEFTQKNVFDPAVRFPSGIPREYTRYCALDPGFHTFGVLWAAVAPDGRVYIYRELYEHAKTHRTVLAQIMSAEGYHGHEVVRMVSDPDGTVREERQMAWEKRPESEEVICHWIDPSSWGHEASGQLKTADLLSRDGLSTTSARNDIEAGIELVRQMLSMGIGEQPGLLVSRHCKHFIDEIRTYRRARDTANPNANARREKPIGRHDHLMDCVRYLALMGLTYVPRNPMEEAYRNLEREVEFARQRFGEDAFRTRFLEEILHREAMQSMPQEHVGGLGTDY